MTGLLRQVFLHERQWAGGELQRALAKSREARPGMPRGLRRRRCPPSVVVVDGAGEVVLAQGRFGSLAEGYVGSLAVERVEILVV